MEHFPVQDTHTIASETVCKQKSLNVILCWHVLSATISITILSSCYYRKRYPHILILTAASVVPHTLIHTDRQMCGQTLRQMRRHSQPWSLCRGCCCRCGQGWRSFPSGCPGPETKDRIYPAHSETMRERGACFCGHWDKMCGQQQPSYTPNSMAARRKRRRQPCSSCKLDCQCSGDHEDQTVMLKWNELIYWWSLT